MNLSEYGLKLSDFDFDKVSELTDTELGHWRKATEPEENSLLSTEIGMWLAAIIFIASPIYGMFGPEGFFKDFWILGWPLAYIALILPILIEALFSKPKMLTPEEELARKVNATCHKELDKRERECRERWLNSPQGKEYTANKEREEREAAEKKRKQQQAAMQAQRRKAQKVVEKHERKVGLRCPSCNSDKVRLVKNTASSLSAGRAAIGAAAFGVEGAIVGAAMGKSGKRTYICCNCGKKYTVKN